MNRVPRPAAAALAAGVLWLTTACGEDRSDPKYGSPAEPTAAEPTGADDRAVTEAQARAALITDEDLPGQWSPADDGGTPAGRMLRGKAGAAACHDLISGLRDNDVVGPGSGATADRTFRGGDSTLSYQVAAYQEEAAVQGLERIKRLPAKCDDFTLTDAHGHRATAQVTGVSLPDTGDDSAGVRMVLDTEVEGLAATLTLEVAAVRVGPNVLTVVNGGLDGADEEATRTAVDTGTDRLREVMDGGTPRSTPGEFD
ncbi:lipoprotein [Streptomyces sodiiphilus]|uniref:Lipoprotein n=1 Tax=Streptomyces sodiiphilus TaxID=226217 RepID=A0ABN2PQT3_9ACTN